MQSRPTPPVLGRPVFGPLVLALLAATTAMGPASADIRTGKLAAQDLAAHYEARHASPKKPEKRAVPACAWIASANPEEAELARRLTLFGLCPAGAQPAEEASPAAAAANTTSGPTIMRGSGACSVVGKVGQSCWGENSKARNFKAGAAQHSAGPARQ